MITTSNQVNDEAPLQLASLDYLMIKWKKVASWENPKYSGLAFAFVTLLYSYLWYTDATTVNLTCYAMLVGYICVTFAETIWPEIPTMYEEKIEVDSNARGEEEEIPESEISIMVEETKNFVQTLIELRANTPGLFCVLCSTFFMILAYFGSMISMLPLLYCVTIVALVMPLASRHLINQFPWVVEKVDKWKDVGLVVLKDFCEKSKVKLEEWGKTALCHAKVYWAKVKESTKTMMDKIKKTNGQAISGIEDENENEVKKD